jgi:L-lactate dehydrogenase complex protein LldG
VTTRAEFLERVRAQIGRAPALFPASAAPRPARPAEAADLVARQMVERWPAALERFRREFERVSGVFHRVRRMDEVPGVIAVIARERGARSLVSWAPPALGLDLAPALAGSGLEIAVAPAGAGEVPRRAHRAAAAAAGLGVTGADWAVAETGTLVLLSGPGRPRSTSLLPETHVAVLGPETLLESLEQLGVMLEAVHAEGTRGPGGAAINLITGPSRTADIELTLTRGVHGPRAVHAVFVEAPARPGGGA